MAAAGGGGGGASGAVNVSTLEDLRIVDLQEYKRIVALAYGTVGGVNPALTQEIGYLPNMSEEERLKMFADALIISQEQAAAQGEKRMARIEAQMEADRGRRMAIIGFILGLIGLIGNFYASFGAANKNDWFKSCSDGIIMAGVITVFVTGILSWAWVKSSSSVVVFGQIFGTSYDKFANYVCTCVDEKGLKQELVGLVRRPIIYSAFTGLLSFGAGDSEKSLIFIFCCIDALLFIIDFFVLKGARLICCNPDYVNELGKQIRAREQAQAQAQAQALQSQLLNDTVLV